MFTKKVSKTILTWSSLAISLLAILGCISPFFAPSPLAGAPSEPLETVIVKTAEAAFTQTAMAIPPTATLTQTPLPTKTSTITPSPTVTVIFSTWTPIVPTTAPVERTGEDYSCTVVSTSPGESMAPRTSFDAKWKVQNTGNKRWDRTNADYYYSSGTRMHDKSAYDFPNNVDPGDSVTLIVDMTAPKNPGSYSTVWRLRVGKTKFCNMNLTVTVK